MKHLLIFSVLVLFILGNSETFIIVDDIPILSNDSFYTNEGRPPATNKVNIFRADTLYKVIDRTSYKVRFHQIFSWEGDICIQRVWYDTDAPKVTKRKCSELIVLFN